MRRLPAIAAVVCLVIASAVGRGGSTGWAMFWLVIAGWLAGFGLGLTMPRAREREPHNPIHHR